MSRSHSADIADDIRAAMEKFDDEPEDQQESPQEDPEQLPDDAGEEEGAQETQHTHSEQPEVDAESQQPEKEPAELKPKKSLKAPVNWGPKEREDWSKIPPHLQEVILNRERDIEQNISHTKQARQIQEWMGGLQNRFGQALQAENATVPQAIESLMTVATNLRSSDPRQRAVQMAGLIQHYGIDVETLDEVLSSNFEQYQQDPTYNRVNQLLEEKLEPFNQLMSQVNQQQNFRHEQSRQEAAKAVQDFSQTAEFYDDVREIMADLIDGASARNQTMSLQDAYDRAVQINPQTREILMGRQKNSLTAERQNGLEKKKTAASSIAGRTSGSPPPAEPSSIRDAILRAMDIHG